LNVLKEVDFIIAEDTRHSSILLSKYEISKPVRSFHGHSSDAKTQSLIDEIKSGKKAALISDAGTPGISDPGFAIITLALSNGIKVIPIPGASAILTALAASGIPTDKFLYLGFLPLKKGRQTLFNSLKDEQRTFVFYESVHRIQKTLQDLYNSIGNRYVCVGREMTKMFEDFVRGDLSEVIEIFKDKSKLKGEFTIVVAPPDYNPHS
jgi:16S rRNA (cytidine1402-2'-O)-methyltransferase